MAPKQKDGKKSKCLKCGPAGPGPKYLLKPVVGYSDHCETKLRMPAYTIAKRRKSSKACSGPGPKYYYQLPGINGYTFPKDKLRTKILCTPAPYGIKSETPGPAYSITPRRPGPNPQCTPGPYFIKTEPPSHMISIGIKNSNRVCQLDPAILDIRPLINRYKPEAPKYSMSRKAPPSDNCLGPGPKYLPEILDKPPAYTFGVKHHECAGISRTEIDE